MANRDYKDHRYGKWRAAVKKRDKYRCRMPGCTVGGRYCRILQVHHIKRWEDYPTLRFVVNNGITLCTTHHKAIWGKEAQYEQLFLQLIVNKKQRDAFLQNSMNWRRINASSSN